MDPYVVVFHDVVYSSESVMLERATESLLERATVSNSSTRTVSISHSRTVSGVWIPNPRLSVDHNELVIRIRQRIKDMSGLRLDSPIHRKIQLLTYGYGGHYLNHNDYLNFTTAGFFYDDRIATVLIYVSVNYKACLLFP